MDKSRLTDEECLRIENDLRERRTPYAIAKALGRPVRTVVREIRARRDPSGKGAFGHLTNRCLLRKGRSVEHKIATQCRRGRTYADSQLFLADNPGCPVTEMDTVEGTKGAKVLLALQFMPWRFMPAFLLERKCSAAVRRRRAAAFGPEAARGLYRRLFRCILTDNGTEFSDPRHIETGRDGAPLARLFNCDPCKSWQKAHVGRNHELLRLVHRDSH